MLRNPLFKLLLFGALSLCLGGGSARASCGDNKLACGADEKCCEHRVATFCEGDACSSVHAEGECIPKGQNCGEFWCGNRQCQTSWLLTKDVCCIYYPGGNIPEYACASSELSCRGNTSYLTIRPTLASSELQRDH
ncbi:MAG: hypothetical protein A2992_06670 [Elusimicrobia bacterium RIFCSPLOWO2_01_FULL_59_12]|nr:MAG: hypothetical protein A2992_06670 [Elusimicrobia bacterium RIFCSPLOWO2_01_FULL_59_12]